MLALAAAMPVAAPPTPGTGAAPPTPGAGPAGPTHAGIEAGAVSATTDVPPCTIGDDPAPFRAYSQWRSTFLDTRFRVGRRYVPPGLVSTADAGTNGGHRVRRLVVDDLRSMVRAARRDGVAIRIASGYRSWAEQRDLYEAFVDRLGPEQAALRAARPGHSEHQLGTAIDVADTSGAHAWVAARGWWFGFVVSYPPGERSVSCYRSEPWHLRYVGRTRAAAIHASGLVPRAWLWIHVVEPMP
jgi:D-alanyl-D-alanine carboxypeptidase